ncbi:MAG: alpha/beta fold hydrolase [Thermoleophilaceae bacterium]
MKRASTDGTMIGFDRRGNGPALILIDGALCHRASGPNRRLAERLSREFSVITYDRRGRGESGDTAPYTVSREVDDLAALIDAAGGSAHLYGISSGGALALEAAQRLPGKIDTVAAYEIPLVIDDSRPPVSESFGDELYGLIDSGRRGAAVKLFMREAVRLPGPLVAAMPLFPGWAKNKRHAPTLRYDFAIMGDTQRGKPLPAGRWQSVTAPTLVMSGGKSPAWVRTGAEQLAQALPNAQHRTLDGQRHYVKANAIGPVLTEFFTAAATGREANPGQAAGRAQSPDSVASTPAA